MIKFKTSNTTFSQSLDDQEQVGAKPIENPVLMRKLKRILNKILPFTNLSGTMELNIFDSAEIDAASQREPLGIVISRAALMTQSEAAIAAELGHELEHILTGSTDDLEEQIKADKFGIELAHKAGYSIPELCTILPLMHAYNDEPERFSAMKSLLHKLEKHS